METRFKFAGNVGQVIGGSATFAAPHTFNQTNNVTVTALALDQRPLLLRQRLNITKRVDQIAAAEGIQCDAIYRVLLEDYGGESIKDMPRGNYRSIVADLDEWLDHIRLAGAAKDDRYSHRLRSSLIGQKAWQRRARVALACVVSVALTMLVLSIWALDDDNPPRHCHWDGKDFSVGSLTTMATSDVYECAFTSDSNAYPQWIPARNLGSACVRHQ